MKKHPVLLPALAATGLSLLAGSIRAEESPAPPKKEKLQIVFCFGQSNMVGLAAVPTAWYITQPPYVPPKEVALQKSRFFDYNFYWSGVNCYQGPRKAELDALLEERRVSRMKWRQRINGVNGIQWDEAAWGKHPGKGRGNVEPFLDLKAEEEGIYKRIAAILDSKDNGFNVSDAYEELVNRDKEIAGAVDRVRGIYLKGAKPEDFDAFDAAVSAAISESVRPVALLRPRWARAPLSRKPKNTAPSMRSWRRSTSICPSRNAPGYTGTGPSPARKDQASNPAPRGRSASATAAGSTRSVRNMGWASPWSAWWMRRSCW